MKELFEALDADPSDVQSWLVYADRLADIGDPRGELITIDLALDDATEATRTALLEQRERLYALHGPTLLGPIGSKAVENGFLTVEWRHGFVTTARYPGKVGWRHLRPVSWMLKVLAEEPYRFLRSIDLSYTDITSLETLPARHLTELVLQGSAFRDLSQLTRFPKLTHLDLSNMRLRDDLVPLYELQSLERLVIGNHLSADVQDLRYVLTSTEIIEKAPHYH